ncbi:CopG family transcriptional regulator [Bacillus suaedae]|uniref:CopG family transcriptional regulator n=1 Tax=Halalkalibacter suaedae TaxID=2822140 RepID=UPI001FF0A672|nr:CopG family transcriptional regulator [Bacillus suaedae]
MEEQAEYRVRGGKREGAGRPTLGTTKKVSITLPDEVWDALEIEKDDETLAGFLREIIMNRH